MTTVLVDYDDLEALLFTCGTIKDIENAIKGRDRDPLVKSASSRLTAAHDRVAAAWRRSKRDDPPAPDASDIAILRSMFPPEVTVAVVNTAPLRLAQTLLLVEYGPIWEGVKIDWPAPSTPEFRQAPSDPRNLRYAARLTVRGQDVLANAEVAGAATNSAILSPEMLEGVAAAVTDMPMQENAWEFGSVAWEQQAERERDPMPQNEPTGGRT
jgi:hypothetical protein